MITPPITCFSFLTFFFFVFYLSLPFSSLSVPFRGTLVYHYSAPFSVVPIIRSWNSRGFRVEPLLSTVVDSLRPVACNYSHILSPVEEKEIRINQASHHLQLEHPSMKTTVTRVCDCLHGSGTFSSLLGLPVEPLTSHLFFCSPFLASSIYEQSYFSFPPSNKVKFQAPSAVSCG